MSKHKTCQDPRTSHLSLAKGHINGMGQQNQLTHWLGIVKILTSYLDVLKANHVSAKLLLTRGIHPLAKYSECMSYSIELVGSISFGAQTFHSNILTD